MNFKKMGVAVLLLVSAVGFAQGPDPQASVGKPLPSFTMRDLSGKTVNNASLRGKVVLIDFWATWCGPCKAASPLMQRLHNTYAKDGLVVLAPIVLDDAGANGARKYQSDNKFTFTFTTGGEALHKSLGFITVPAFVFVDKQGVVRHVASGFRTSDEAAFEARVKQMLGVR
jgi:cytochrome c biogenesis protein CcmG, thiol:disulfide interchange protein DsbE